VTDDVRDLMASLSGRSHWGQWGLRSLRLHRKRVHRNRRRQPRDSEPSIYTLETFGRSKKAGAAGPKFDQAEMWTMQKTGRTVQKQKKDGEDQSYIARQAQDEGQHTAGRAD